MKADALWTAAQQATAQSDWESAEPLLEEARALFRVRGRGREEVSALANLSFVALRRDDPDRALALAESALESRTRARKSAGDLGGADGSR